MNAIFIFPLAGDTLNRVCVLPLLYSVKVNFDHRNTAPRRVTRRRIKPAYAGEVFIMDGQFVEGYGRKSSISITVPDTELFVKRNLGRFARPSYGQRRCLFREHLWLLERLRKFLHEFWAVISHLPLEPCLDVPFRPKFCFYRLRRRVRTLRGALAVLVPHRHELPCALADNL